MLWARKFVSKDYWRSQESWWDCWFAFTISRSDMSRRNQTCYSQPPFCEPQHEESSFSLKYYNFRVQVVFLYIRDGQLHQLHCGQIIYIWKKKEFVTILVIYLDIYFKFFFHIYRGHFPDCHQLIINWKEIWKVSAVKSFIRLSFMWMDGKL